MFYPAYLVGGIGYIQCGEPSSLREEARGRALSYNAEMIPPHHKFVMRDDGTIIDADSDTLSSSTWNNKEELDGGEIAFY